MSDSALEAAEKKAIDLRAAIASLKNKIADDQARLSRLSNEAAAVDDWIRTWHQLAGTPYIPAGMERSEITLPVGKPKRPKNPDREIVVEKALQIIRERGEPMSRRDLFEALKEQGIELRGKDPEMVLSTMLWRSQDRIERLIPFGYWPTGVEYAPATALR